MALGRPRSEILCRLWNGKNAMEPRSYAEMNPSGPGVMPLLMPGTQNLLDYVSLGAGEYVLLLAEHSVHAGLIGAISSAATLRGGDVSVLYVDPWKPGGMGTADPSPIVVAAWEAADVVISCAWWSEVHTGPLFFTELRRLGSRLAAVHQAATLGAFTTGARFPPEIFYEIKSRVLDRVVGSSEIRVTTTHGTDIRFARMRFDTDNGPLEEPGSWSPFPYGGVNWYPDDTSGTVMIEECTVTGVPTDPLTLVLDSNRVVDITGGIEARDLELFSPGGYYMRHAFIGLNPKVRVKGAPQFEREKHAGAFYFGIDSLDAADRAGPGRAHCDCQFDRPTITVDGKLLVDRGRLMTLDHPSVRDTAARYGDPDLLLSDSPVLW